MNNIYLSIVTTLFTFLSIDAQVGIATTSPTRTLDVNGDLRVTTYTNQSNNDNYPNILAANTDGDVDFIRKQSIPQNPDLQTEMGRAIYITAPGTPLSEYKWATCGDIRTRINNNGAIQIQGISNLASNVANLGTEIWYGTNGVYNYITQNLAIFSSTIQSGGFITAKTTRIINAVHPITGDYYKLTYSVNTNSATTNNYSAVCERYYNVQ